MKKKLACPCGNTKNWDTITTTKDKVEAVCGECGRFVEADMPLTIGNMTISNGIHFN